MIKRGLGAVVVNRFIHRVKMVVIALGVSRSVRHAVSFAMHLILFLPPAEQFKK